MNDPKSDFHKEDDQTTSASSADERELFPPPAEPRYFGTGSYGTGGPIGEGNYALGEVNPRGGYGTFTDAGGPGSTALLGEEERRQEPSTVQPKSHPKA